MQSKNFDSTYTSLKLLFMCMLSKLCYLYFHLFFEELFVRFFNSSIAEGHISHFLGFLKSFLHFSIIFVSVTLFFQHFLRGPNWLNCIIDVLKCCNIKRKVIIFNFLSLPIFLNFGFVNNCSSHRSGAISIYQNHATTGWWCHQKLEKLLFKFGDYNYFRSGNIQKRPNRYPSWVSHIGYQVISIDPPRNFDYKFVVKEMFNYFSNQITI